MPSQREESSDRFTIVCPHCRRQLLARAEWVQRDVQCPHCAELLRVPPRPDGEQLPWGSPPPSGTAHRFSFPCPRCQSLLESHLGTCGQTGRCPTCNARFVVPHLASRTGAPQRARLLDRDDQDPTPMHAYAASGHQAPRIRRRDDGTPLIECPRCGAHSDISVDNCPGCGVPFTLEGVATPASYAGRSLAITSLVLGLVSVPPLLCFAPFPLGLLAIVFGVASWFRRGTAAPSGQALAGIILGAVSMLPVLLF